MHSILLEAELIIPTIIEIAYYCLHRSVLVAAYRPVPPISHLDGNWVSSLKEIFFFFPKIKSLRQDNLLASENVGL